MIGGLIIIGSSINSVDKYSRVTNKDGEVWEHRLGFGEPDKRPEIVETSMSLNNPFSDNSIIT